VYIGLLDDNDILSNVLMYGSEYIVRNKFISKNVQYLQQSDIFVLYFTLCNIMDKGNKVMWEIKKNNNFKKLS
jgi:hypothetical protein